MESVIKFYANTLACRLESPGGLSNARDIANMFQATAEMQPQHVEKIFVRYIDTYGNESGEEALLSIQSQLEKLNREHEGVSTNGPARIKKHQQKIADLKSKMAVQINGEDFVAGDAGEKEKPQMIEATAQYKNAKIPLAVAVKKFNNR
jgi:hypothetical protein